MTLISFPYSSSPSLLPPSLPHSLSPPSLSPSLILSVFTHLFLPHASLSFSLSCRSIPIVHTLTEKNKVATPLIWTQWAVLVFRDRARTVLWEGTAKVPLLDGCVYFQREQVLHIHNVHIIFMPSTNTVMIGDASYMIPVTLMDTLSSSFPPYHHNLCTTIPSANRKWQHYVLYIVGA